jgi:DNA-binding NarL/FixJ family response regulator
VTRSARRLDDFRRNAGLLAQQASSHFRHVGCQGKRWDLDSGRASRDAFGASARRLHERLTLRELEVLGLMAEGRSNGAIPEQFVLTIGAVEKHVANIFMKLRLPPSETDNRRVLAVLAYLQGQD